MSLKDVKERIRSTEPEINQIVGTYIGFIELRLSGASVDHSAFTYDRTLTQESIRFARIAQAKKELSLILCVFCRFGANASG